MGQLVCDESVQAVGGRVDRQDDTVALWLGKRTDAFWARARNDVLLLKLAVGLEDDEGDDRRQVVPEVGADLLVRALGIARDALEVLLQLWVVENLEVVCRIDMPIELVVLDLILPVERVELALGTQIRGDQRNDQERKKHVEQTLGSDSLGTTRHMQMQRKHGDTS